MLRKLNSDFETKYISEIGTKQRNKDYFGYVELNGYACWAIAESYDGDPETVSARLAVETVLELFTKKPSMSKRGLKAYVREAHRQLKEQSLNFQLRASILVVASDYTRLRYVSCGNARLLMFRGGRILARNRDQSMYQEMLDREEVSDDGTQGVEESRNLFGYLGKPGRLDARTSKPVALSEMDILLLSTWGFWEKVSAAELLDAAGSAKEPGAYLDELQELYLGRQGSQVNNFTVATVFVNKPFREKETKKPC
jgi:serine/threonine protein phosphatase PrpC